MSLVIDGMLKPDGIVQLDAPPQLRLGRVRVTLQPLAEGQTAPERLPDAPWMDESIPAPFDLPRSGACRRVRPRVVAERLPEILEWVPEK